MNSSDATSRVRLYIPALRRGGAERVCVSLANVWASEGRTVELCTLSDGHDALNEELLAAVPRVDLGCTRARHALPALISHLRRSPPAIALAFTLELAILLKVAIILAGRRDQVVARLINTISHERKAQASWFARKAVPAMARPVFRRLPLVIAQSSGMALDAMSFLRISPDRIVTIPNPVASSFLDAPSRLPKTGQILFAGRLTHQKDLDLLLKAFAIVAAAEEQASLVIAGNGPEEYRLRQLAEQLGIQSRVRFCGELADMASAYGAAHVVALSSRFEGFPNVLVEAHACGRPTVGVVCPSGVDDIVIEDVNGYCVRTRAPEDLAALLLKALRRQWDSEAIRQTARRFDPRLIATRYWIALQGLNR